MKLRCIQREGEIELQEGSNLIGRNPDCAVALPLDSSGVSRKHAECLARNGSVQIRDLGSRNGTVLNGQQLIPREWYAAKNQDRMTICDFEFTFYDDQIPDASHGSVVLSRDGLGSRVDASSISLSSRALGDLPAPKQFNQLHAMIRVTSALRGILETNEVLEEAARILLDVFPDAERSVIGFVDEAGEITPRWWHLRQTDPSSEIRISKTIVEGVVASSEAVLSNDAQDRFADAESIPALSIRALMCAPLFGEANRVVGFVHVDTSSRGRFDETDLQILAAVATQVSLALGYSRMHESVVHDRIYMHDLKQAREVQQQYLPDMPPKIEGYEISSFYRAARHVGGDYLDFIQLSNGQHLFVLGDVEGKGAPAALTMVRLATETQASSELCSSPAELLTRLNARITEKWVTYAAVQLDPNKHTVQVANAAQELPLLSKADGSIEELTVESRGLPFSVLPDESYQQDELTIQPGEMLVLFSDGFPDSVSESGERFGIAGVLNILRSQNEGTPDLASRLCESIDSFRGRAEQFDDMCLICIKRVS